jgi:predicted transcriptional regulator
MDVYKTYDIIKNSISKSEYMNAILPFSYTEINDGFNKLLSKNKKVHIISPRDIKEFLIKSFNVSDDNLKIDFMDIDEINYILLLCSDKKMILGLFKDDTTFDKNRLLISTHDSSIKWANELFDHFDK